MKKLKDIDWNLKHWPISRWSLIISLFALLTTSWIGFTQIRYDRNQNELNQILIRKEIEADKPAINLEVGWDKFYTYIRIRNVGGSSAFDVNIKVNEDSQWEIKPGYLPYPKLYSTEFVDIIFSSGEESEMSAKCKVEWKDSEGKKYSKETTLSL